jgi:hypothetical protein
MDKKELYELIEDNFEDYCAENNISIMQISEYEYLYRNKSGNLSLKYGESIGVSLKSFSKDALKDVLNRMY